jgi:hypothetical protein
MGALTSVLQPAMQAFQKTGGLWAEVLKGCAG